MKYLILILLFVTTIAQAQNITPIGNTTQIQYNKGSYKTDRLFILPRTFTPFPSFDSTASIWFDSAGTKTLWYHNGTARVQLGSGGGDSSLFFTNYRADTMRRNIYGAINAGSADSTKFTTIYRDDTGKKNIRATIAGKQAYSDTFTWDATKTDLTNYLPLQGGIMQGFIDMDDNTLTGIPTPVNAGDAVPLDYLQMFLTGLSWKASVLAATNATLPPFTFSGPNSLMFNSVGACPVIDGITLRLGSSILNKNSTGSDTAYNGIFTVTQLGNVSTTCILTRRTDANTELLLRNATVSADSGIVNMGKGYTQTNTITTINVTPVTFVPILDAVAVAGRGLGKAGNIAYVDSSVVMYNHDFIDSMTHYFAKKDSNTVKNPVTLTYANNHYLQSYSETDPLSFHKVDSNTHGNAVTLDYLNSHSSAPDSTIFSTVYRNDTGNKNLRNTKVAYADSANMLLPYLHKGDTVTLSNRINLKVNYSDSGSVYYTKYGTDTAKTVIRGYTVTQGSGYGILGGGAAQAISANPSRTLVLDSATAYPAVLGTLAAGTGLSKSGRTFTNTAPDQTVTLANGWAWIPTGTYPNFTGTVDSGLVDTKAWRQKGIDSLANIISTGSAPSQSWTLGSIPYAGSTGNNTLTQDNANLFYNSTTKSVGIGTVSPTANLDIRGTTNATMANFQQAWTGSASPVGVIIAAVNSSSGTGKMLSVRAGAGGTTERFYVDASGNVLASNTLQTPNIWSPLLTTTLAIRNQTGNASGPNSDGVSFFMDRAGTNKMQFTQASGQTNAIAIYPTYNQLTSSASNTDFLINRTQTSIGSGTQRLLDLQVGSTTMHNISNTGVNYNADAVLVGGAANDGTNKLIVTGSAAISSVPTGARTDAMVRYNPATGQLRQLQPYDSIVATGNTTYSVVPNGQLFSITFKPTGSETIKVGTTSGGTEVMVGTAFGAGTTTTVTINKEFGPVATTLFIQGATGSVNYHIRVQ